MADLAQQQEFEDSQNDDGASSVGDSSVDESLLSLRSSILDYRRENGRTYHRMSDGNLNHHIWILTWEGEICVSPKKHGAKRVLDVGTGTGVWAMDYGNVPPNCSFEVDDLEKSWTWREPFDYIFIRSMLSCFSSWPDIIAKAYDALEPGGYLELQDHMCPLMCDDGTMSEDFKPLKWGNMLIEASKKTGRTITMAATFKQMLEDAGFVDIEEKKEFWPFNQWAKDKKYRDLGYWMQESALKGIEAVSLATFTRFLDWSPEETRVFCAEVRNEHKKIGVHAYYDVYGVWGRKPEKTNEDETAAPAPASVATPASASASASASVPVPVTAGNES
ncbi:Putative S-adenosyl-L-methionine-dependent methyltransferase superfamily [Colletotrichum destructivum]|uniref:S-adenosyl-L-methionine-dependent methyltransferase superfamily n=1 Tax=Colletotrichum destructivum TaxID=34406 RepID=A0AAX4J4I5_9PEZI|nr:Putative S-adenosyl-L-methionine-dependent methyltransferase superfamily [Colletotrichum destructivum]